MPTTVNFNSNLKLIAFSYARAIPGSTDEEVALGLIRAKLAQQYGVMGRMFRLPIADKAQEPECPEFHDLDDQALSSYAMLAVDQLRTLLEAGCEPSLPGTEAHAWHCELKRATHELASRLCRKWSATA